MIDLLAALLALQDAGTDGERIFARRVSPLLEARCAPCHGGDPGKTKGGLDVTSRPSLLRGGESGPAVVPGRPDAGTLLRAVSREDPDRAMPPKEADRVADGDIAALRAWIAAGAPWPDAARRATLRKEDAAGVRAVTSGGQDLAWTERLYDAADLWAYRPIEDPSVSPGAAHPVDGFLDVGPGASPRADRPTLLRRVSFDLTGLPPEADESSRFVKDPAPDREAFARLVDRLLESPRYGEHWGRKWLDLVRYADTAGGSNDYPRPHAWRYRDYVIRAFNEDRPYGRFVREQIAGDEIDPADPELRVAAGFLRMGPWEQTMMSVARETRQQFLDDVVAAVGHVFLAMPLQCARCHDHKFDPIPTRDYYRLQAVFATTQFAEPDAAFLPTENRARFREETALLDRQIARFETISEDVKRRSGEFSTEVSALRRIAAKNLNRLRWERMQSEPVAYSVYSGVTRLPADVFWRLSPPADPAAGGAVEETAILKGGALEVPGERVAPGVLSVVEGVVPSSIPAGMEGRRRALADWVADPRNPLAMRAIVNRVWLGHFGRGLAPDPDNFGAKGGRPSHPRLLDWLSSRFAESGGSIKALHRLILGSDAYARSSKGPADDGYGTFRLRRLEAEEIRDAMLWVSGELNRESGGLPVRPGMNLEAAFQPRQLMGTFAAAYQPSPEPRDRNRRTVYALRIRGLPDPLLEVLDRPRPDACGGVRATSTGAPQALSLFNGEEVHARARATARRLLEEGGTPEDAIVRLFLLASGRSPTAAQKEACRARWEAAARAHAGRTLGRRGFPRELARLVTEEDTGERFRFVERLDAGEAYRPDVEPADLDARGRSLAELCLVVLNSSEFLFVR